MIRPTKVSLATILLLIPHALFAAGGADISSIFLNLITLFSPLWMIIAFLMLVIAGFQLVSSTDEGTVDKARKIVAAVVIGGIVVTIILVVGPSTIVSWFMHTSLGGRNVVTNTAGLINAEILGVSSWFSSIAAMIGMLTIIIAMLKAVSSFGGDQAAYDGVRKAVFQVIIGLLVIAIAYTLENVFYNDGTPNPLLTFMAGIMQIVLGFILLIAIGILIYAGFRMVVSFGNEDAYSSSKSLLIRVITGILVIAISYTLVWTVVTVMNG